MNCNWFCKEHFNLGTQIILRQIHVKLFTKCLLQIQLNMRVFFFHVIEQVFIINITIQTNILSEVVTSNTLFRYWSVSVNSIYDFRIFLFIFFCFPLFLSKVQMKINDARWIMSGTVWHWDESGMHCLGLIDLSPDQSETEDVMRGRKIKH